ncbi:MAG TPA: hemerythrin domain-containing protein [Solirubrobacterales bacterium]
MSLFLPLCCQAWAAEEGRSGRRPSPTAAFREEHAALLEHVEHLRAVAAGLPTMGDAERTEELKHILDFLRGTLIPHAEAEERVLYPAVAELLGDPRSTATMISDHHAIVARIEALAASAPDDVERLQELLYGLHALLIVHFHKEEDDYLPLLEARPAQEVAALFEEMGHGHEH